MTHEELALAMDAFIRGGGEIKKLPDGYAEIDIEYVNDPVSLDPERDTGCRWNGALYVEAKT